MNSQLGKIRLAVLLLILANVIWGASFPIYKWSLEVIPPFSFAFLRFFIGALIILPFVIKSLKVSRQDIPLLVLVSIFSVTIQIPLLFLGLNLSPSINAPIIISSGPIFLIIASVLFLKEKLRLKVLLGTLVSLFGVLAIILRPFFEGGFSTDGILGNFFIFIATFCGVVQAIGLKKIMVRNNPLTVTFWMFLIGSLPLLPLALREAEKFDIFAINTQGAIGLIYGIVLAAVLAHYFLAFGIKYIKASEVGVFTYVDPIATIVIAVPLLHEAITFTYLIGAALVFLGIFIAEGRVHYHPVHKLRA